MTTLPETHELGITLAGHVAVVEIRRPPNNFLDTELITQLVNGFVALASTPCRCIVLASAGKHFSAGAQQPLGGGPELQRHDNLYDVACSLFEQRLPIVAAVQGAAIGGGLGLALAADFRIATPESRFAANFAQLGFHHGFGLTVTLPLVVGHQASLDLLYTGRRITGENALVMGLVDRLVSQDHLRSAAVGWAEEIAQSAPLAVDAIRQTMRGHLAAQVRQSMQHERSEQLRLRATADWTEGVAAMQARRSPNFEGR